jgi:hypothetical protein
MQNMMAYASDFFGSRTFRLLPLTNDCPFNEAIYDTNAKVLAIISKDKKEKPTMLPKLNDKGLTIPLKGAGENALVEERRILDMYFEYYMDNADDIKAFIREFVINPEHPAIEEAMNRVEEAPAEEPKQEN